MLRLNNSGVCIGNPQNIDLFKKGNAGPTPTIEIVFTGGYHGHAFRIEYKTSEERDEDFGQLMMHLI